MPRRPILLGCAVLLASCKPVLPPVAAANGPADSQPLGQVVVLDGSASADPQGRPLEYRWRMVAQPPGSRASLVGPDRAVAALRPDVEGDYRVALAVSNGLLTASSEVAFTARCGGAAPVVSLLASPASSGVGDPVTFRAEWTDADAQAPCELLERHVLRWSVPVAPAGSRARLMGTEGAKPHLIPDLPGEYRVQVAVIDSSGRKGSSEVALAVDTCGSQPPEVVALEGGPAVLGVPLSVRAEVRDPDAEPPCGRVDPLALSWRLTSMPAGSRAALSGSSELEPWFVPDIAGAYALQLEATDSTGRTGRGDLRIEVGPCGGSPPVVVAVIAEPAAPATGQAFSLATEIQDADGVEPCGLRESHHTSWALIAQPAGSRARLSDAGALHPWLRPDLPGEYTVEVLARDAAGLAGAPKRLSIQASACGASPPSASIAAPPAGALGAPVQVRALASDADSAEPCLLSERLSYRWSFLDLPAGSRAGFNDPGVTAPSFVPDVVGTYRVGLSVLDAAGHLTRAEAAVSVGACGANPPAVQMSAVPAEPAVGQPVLLEALALDPDSEPPCSLASEATFAWTLLAVPAGSLAALGGHGAAASLVPDVPGEYVVRVVATDATGRASRAARTSINATPCGRARPRVRASASESVPSIAQPVQLSVVTEDADAQPPCGIAEAFTFEWSLQSLPAGSRAILWGADGPAPWFAPDVPGTYLARVIAFDRAGLASEPSTVEVTAPGCGAAAPTVSALEPVPGALAVGVAARLVPQVEDADNEAPCAAGQHFEYAWSLQRTPAGSRASLGDPSAREPSLRFDAPGEYEVRLVVTDSSGRSSAPAVRTLAVSGCGASAPVVEVVASPSASAGVGATVTLEGSFADADDEAACQQLLGNPQGHRFSWRLAGTPEGSEARLAGESLPAASLRPDREGRYEVALVVTDSTGRAGEGRATLTVGPCGTAAPAASPRVSASSSLRIGGVVRLEARATDADDVAPCREGQALSYRWWLAEAPPGSAARLGQDTTGTPSFEPDVAGTYVAAVRVEDSTGRSAVGLTAPFAVAACGGNAPVARIGALSPSPMSPEEELAVALPACGTLQLDARGSSDADASCGLPQTPDHLLYRWETLSAPEGSAADLVLTGSATPWFEADMAGVWVFRLWASDGERESARPALATVLAEGAGINRTSPIDPLGGGATSLVVVGSRPRMSFFEGGPGGDQRLHYAECAAGCDTGSATWTRAVLDPTLGRGRSNSLRSLTEAGATRLALAYHDQSNGDLLYRECANASSTGCLTPANWAAGTIDSSTSADVGGAVSLAVRGSLRAVVYYDAVNRDLRYAECSGSCASGAGNWAKGVVDTGGASGNDVGSHASLDIDPSGRRVVAYYDATARKLKYAECSANCTGAGNGWNRVTLTVGSLAGMDAGEYPSVNASSNDARPRIAFYNRTDGNLWHASCNSAQCTQNLSTWSQTQPADASPEDVGAYAALAVDSLGDSHIAYYDATRKRLKIIRGRLASWQATPIVRACGDNSETGAFNSIVLDPQDPSKRRIVTGPESGARLVYYAEP